MFKNRILIIIAGLLLSLPGISQALSLGEIKVYSHFAQPFSAEITIPSYTSDELENLEVSLASVDKFKSLGLEILPSVEQFIFEIAFKPNGVPFVKIYSKKPIKELSISFVVEASWIGGRLIKDFHILLTPEAITELRDERLMEQQLAQVDAMSTRPIDTMDTMETMDTIEESSLPPIEAPSSVSAVASEQFTEDSLEPAPSIDVNQARAPTAAKKLGSNGIEYTVNSGDSLSQIAMNVKPDPSVSMYQTMVTLYEQNKHAFVNENINLVKAGATLRIDDVNRISQLSKNEARQLAFQYFTNKQQNNVVEESSSAPQVAEVPPAPEANDDGARLEISSVEEESIPPEVIEKLKLEQIANSVQELKTAINATNDLEVQNAELRDRITSIELKMAQISAQLNLDEDLVVPESAPEANSATQEIDNLIVTNTDLAMEEHESMSLIDTLKAHQMNLSIAVVFVLSMTLIGVRKKAQIKQAIDNYKHRSKDDEETTA